MADIAGATTDTAVYNIEFNTQPLDHLYEQMGRVVELQQRMNDLTEQLAGKFDLVAKSTHGLVERMSHFGHELRQMRGHVSNITGHFLKWGTIVGAVAALLGVGGSLFGIDRLAKAAMEKRRALMGAPTEPTGGKALALTTFGTTFWRDPKAVFAAAEVAARDPMAAMRQQGLVAMGADVMKAIRSGEAVDVADAEARYLLNAAKRGVQPYALQRQGIIGPGAATGIDVEQYNKIRQDIPRAERELEDLEKDIRDHWKEMGTTQEAMDAWTKLIQKINHASGTIETTLINKLSPLAEPLGRLSDGFGKLFDKIMGSEGVNAAIEGFATGLNNFVSQLYNAFRSKEEFGPPMKVDIDRFGLIERYRWDQRAAAFKHGRLPSSPGPSTPYGQLRPWTTPPTPPVTIPPVDPLQLQSFGGEPKFIRPRRSGLIDIAYRDGGDDDGEDRPAPTGGDDDGEDRPAPTDLTQRLRQMLGGGDTAGNRAIAIGRDSAAAADNSAVAKGYGIAIAGNTVKALGGAAGLIAWLIKLQGKAEMEAAGGPLTSSPLITPPAGGGGATPPAGGGGATPPAGGGGAIGKAEQNANSAAIQDELRKAGMSNSGIAGSLGSMQQESGFNPRAHNDIGGGHTGLWQWDARRWGKVSAWIKSQGGDPFDARWQARAYIAEGRAKPGDPIYDNEQTSAGFSKIEKSTSLDEAMSGVQMSERYGKGEEGARGPNARAWLPLVEKGAGAAAPSAPTPPVSFGGATPTTPQSLPTPKKLPPSMTAQKPILPPPRGTYTPEHPYMKVPELPPKPPQAPPPRYTWPPPAREYDVNLQRYGPTQRPQVQEARLENGMTAAPDRSQQRGALYTGNWQGAGPQPTLVVRNLVPGSNPVAQANSMAAGASWMI